MKYFRFLFIILLFVGCSHNNEEDSVDTSRTEADVRADFNNLIINTGINDFKLESNKENFFWDFRIIAPASASDSNKRPLIISLHGGSTIISNLYKNTDCLIQSGLESLDAYIISPSSKGIPWFDKLNQNQILALVDLASTTLPIDTNKILITGFSDGGVGSWFFSQFYSNIFSASIPMASSYSGLAEEISVPMYVIHGSDDDLFPLAITEGLVNSFNAAGSNIEFVIAEGLTHTTYCEYASFLQDAAIWVDKTWNN